MLKTILKVIFTIIIALIICFTTFSIQHYFGDPFGVFTFFIGAIGGVFACGIAEFTLFE